ncbi:PREDICTED: uncharacterized protein LOC105570403 [Vollenhovia emeryi]|uniref:uncharacterized protein LOC105570403 n=1 Tax=Vollenhovia emeryi TaxID=411798 RepID=UPI0005F4AF77|nr:PREDICTED: uncharacterized protein LOC105570403 [Vollenhovia emeryi]
MNVENEKDPLEPSRCFICNDEIRNRFYCLATCRTQNSGTRVIKKLGELVGERYMIVISEDDVICRSCANLINALDRLETEMHKTRDHILLFLEQKYSLENGELRGDAPKPSQPPQITRSKTKSAYVNSNQQNESDPGPDDSLAKSSYDWLQCDRCKYTTCSKSFMVHHMRDHIKQRSICEDCGQYVTENQGDQRHCCRADDLGNKENEAGNSGATVKSEAGVGTALSNKQVRLILPVTQTTPPPLIGISNYSDHLYLPLLLGDSASSSQQLTLSSQQLIYAPQPINTVDNIVDNSRKSTRLPTNPAQETTAENGNRRHVLTVKEDGSLQMVEIMPETGTRTPNIKDSVQIAIS